MTRRRIIALTPPNDRQFGLYVLPHLREAHAQVMIVDPWLLTNRRLAIDPGPGGLQVRYGSRLLTADPANTTVYFGKPRSPYTAPVPPVNPSAHVQQQLQYSWRDLLVALEGMAWVSDYNEIRRSMSKALQLQTASQILLTGSGTNRLVRVPQWTLSSNPVRVPRFIRRQWASHGVCIAKPIESDEYRLGGPRYASRAILLTPDSTDPDSVPGLSPKFLQQYVRGREITVQVMGLDVFAGEYVAKDGRPLPEVIVDIHDAADQDNIRVIGHTVPPEVADFCRELTLRRKLRCGRIDFKLDRNGRYWFLEINPVGMWRYLQRHTGQPIGESLAGLLLRG